MSRPDLYRVGNWDKVRTSGLNPDIQLDEDGNVIPGTGGVSCFDHPQEGWPDSRRTWQLASNTEIPSGLTVAQGGVPHHYIIAPVERVPLNTYTTQLAQIDTTATLVRPDVATTGPLSQTGYSTSKHPSKSVWSVCEALVAVRRGPIVIPDWDANDYALVGAIAAALDAGEVDLDGPTWKGGEETTKVERVAAQAVGAYVQKIRAEFHVQEAAHADDDDWYDGTPMDIFVLCNALGILREGNPLNALVPDDDYDPDRGDSDQEDSGQETPV